MKTIRRGSFFASDWNPASIFVCSIFVSRWSTYHSTDLLHTPEMHADKKEGQQRKNDYMQDIEAEQGVFTDDISTQRHKADFSPNHRHGRDDVGADGHGPERQLVPRQQISRVTEKEGNQEQKDADNPIKFVRGFIAAAIEHVKHVPEHEQHHEMSAQAMHIAQKHSVGHHKLQVLHVPVRVGDGG